MASCGLTHRKNLKRANDLEWEHIVPFSWFYQGRLCATKAFREENCTSTSTSGKVKSARKCCAKTDELANRFESDLFNLRPSPLGHHRRLQIVRLDQDIAAHKHVRSRSATLWFVHPLRLRNTNSCPDTGSRPSVSATNITKPSICLRKSTGWRYNHTAVLNGNIILVPSVCAPTRAPARDCG